MFSAKRMRVGVAGGLVATTATNLVEHALVLAQRPNTAPISGGPLVINGQAIGTYDYTVKSATTLASFVDSDWFTATKDTASAWVIVNGNLTINSGVTLRPAARKLLTVVCVTGDLTLNGSISMSQRGANHSGTGDSGGLTPPVPVRVYSGAISTYTNPDIGATGGTGGAGVTAGATYLNGTVGGLAASIGTGGGGSGSAYLATSGAGASGTCFSGGAGGGAGSGENAYAGVANGGAGGIGTNGAWYGVGNGPNGVDNGTGGVLVVIVLGSVSGSGSITAAGGSLASTWFSPYNTSFGMGGGASGGGVALLIRRSGLTPAISAPGGTSVITNGFANGGSGGNGFAGAWTLPTTSAWIGGNQYWTSPDSDSFNNVFINGNAASISSSVTQTITIVGTVAPSSTAFAVSANVLTIAGVLGGGPISKSGTGQVSLDSPANTFVGDVTLSGGVLKITDDGSLGNASNSLVFAAAASAALKTVGAVTLSRNVSIASNAAATFAASSAIITGVLSGSGSLTWAANFVGTCRLTNANNTFSGPISVLAGSVEAVSLSDSAGAISLGNSGLATQFTWVGAAKTFNNRPISLFGTTGGGEIRNNSANAADTLTFNTHLLVSKSGNKSLVLGGSNAGTNAFNGIIGDGSSAVISVSKSGVGLWRLGGNNTYSGGTTISAGTLSAGSANAFGTGAVTVNTGATLRLNGYTIPNTIVNNGGTVIP